MAGIEVGGQQSNTREAYELADACGRLVGRKWPGQRVARLGASERACHVTCGEEEGRGDIGQGRLRAGRGQGGSGIRTGYSQMEGKGMETDMG